MSFAPPVSPIRRRLTPEAGLLRVLAFILALAVQPSDAADSPPAGESILPELVHFGFSRRVFGAVNENDGRAALKTHARAILSGEGLSLAADFPLLEDAAQINEALRLGTVDFVALTADEFIGLDAALIRGPLISISFDGKTEDSYVLVTRCDRGPASVSSLRGRRITVVRSPRAPVSTQWLDVLALREAGVPADKFAGSITVVDKASRAVLPVFFGQADAAVVNRAGLAVLSELNPQIARQLRIIASSPPMVSTVMCFRAGVSDALLQRAIATTSNLQNSASGRQLLMIFQSGPLTVIPPAAVGRMRELLTERRQLLAAPPSAYAAEAVHPTPAQ